MGRKAFNVRGRQSVKTVIDKSSEKEIKVDLAEGSEYRGYDEANALVLPSKKRGTKQHIEKHTTTKILSKKQRKKLEKIVDKKKKKEGRSSLLEALASVQLPSDELRKYISISQAQTIGVRNFHKLSSYNANESKEDVEGNNLHKSFRISSIAGINKRKRQALLEGYNNASSSEDEAAESKKPKDYNVVGLTDESDSSEGDTDDQTRNEQENGIFLKNNDQTIESNDHQGGIHGDIADARILDLSKGSISNLIKSSDNTVFQEGIEVKNAICVEDECVESTVSGWIVEKCECKNVNPWNVDNKNDPMKEKLVNHIQETLGTEKLASTIESAERKPVTYIHVYRDPKIQAARLKLPILAEEQVIMETINDNQIIILEGETGSGKTTQVPQFLYEAGFAEKKMIGITEPRRVAAISMSKRVGNEMNLSDKEVSYLIRFEGNATDKTKIKFMTDGVLLKEIETDYMLSKYSVIILDEAHERSAYTDILVGLLSRIVPLRNKKNMPLKLIIMSATLRVGDFTTNRKLFSSVPPVLKVEARQFHVKVHFQKKTPEDYITEAYKKTLKIHSKLPEGGILIFLTGQLEINHLVRKLRKQFPYFDASGGKHNLITNRETNSNDSECEMDIKYALKNAKKARKRLAAQISLPKINLDDYKLPTDDTEADLLENEEKFSGSDLDTDNNDVNDKIEEEMSDKLTKQPLWVLPLYSLMSTEKQNRIFQPPPEGCRLCIVTTNVAETSLTIPNIKYVVDSGRQKTRLYDVVTGVSSFVVTFTTKASADQRAGRAGRVSEGHCYRLYSSARFTEFEDFAVPDIQKKPIDDLMLQMKSMGIDKVINFPFPSPPDIMQLQMAERRLTILGALEESTVIGKQGTTTVFKVSRLGKAISEYPVAPRFGKMLALSHQQNLLPYSVCMVASMSVQQLLMEDTETNGNKLKWYNKRKSWAKSGHYQLLGDPWILIRATGEAEYARSRGTLDKVCEEYGLSQKALTEVRKLRRQLTNQINLSIPGVELVIDPQMNPPTDIQAKFLRQIILAGLGDQVARKIPRDEIKDKESLRHFKYGYQCPEMKDPVFMHSGSVLKKEQPEWVVYQEAFELDIGTTKKTFIRGITAIEPEWLFIYVPMLCNIRVVREDPQPKFNAAEGKVYCYVEATFGRAGWPLPMTEIEMPLNELACKYFGMFFLNGDVCPKLSQYKQKLKLTPRSLLKNWSNLNFNITNFTKALTSKQINSRKKLYDIWKSEPAYLLEQYSGMINDVGATELSMIWPPLDE